MATQILFKKYSQFLKRLYDITWFGTINRDALYEIMIISCDYLNLSFKLPIKLQYSH